MRPVTETVAGSWTKSLNTVCETFQEPVPVAIMVGIAFAAYFIFFRK